MFYIYILQSLIDYNFYVGYTIDLKNRFKEHNNGKIESTKNRKPLRLIYYEACLNQKDAIHREKYLKTAWGKRYIKSRLKNYLMGLGERTTTEIHRANNSKGIPKLKNDARVGGQIAGSARKQIERKIGRSVVSEKNFLNSQNFKKIKE